MEQHHVRDQADEVHQQPGGDTSGDTQHGGDQ